MIRMGCWDDEKIRTTLKNYSDLTSASTQGSKKVEFFRIEALRRVPHMENWENRKMTMLGLLQLQIA